MGPENWQTVCQVVILASVITGGLGTYGSWHFRKQIDKEKPDVSEPQKPQLQQTMTDSPGGMQAGGNISIIVPDKEALGIRDEMGLYRGGKKVATVASPILDEQSGLFECAAVIFEEPLGLAPWQSKEINDKLLGVYEFRSFRLEIQKFGSLAANPIPKLSAVVGKIVGQR